MSEPHKRNLPVPFFSQRENKYKWQRIALNKENGGENVQLNAKEGIDKTFYKADENIGFPVSLAWSTCNMTSLCMILHYFGITYDSPDEMLEKFFNADNCKFRKEAYAGGTGPNRLLWGGTLKEFVVNTYNLPDNYITHRSETMTLDDVKRKIGKGYPVWLSYGPTVTKEKSETVTEKYEDNYNGRGHISVIRGFTNDGDVILNDPWGDPSNEIELLNNYPADRPYSIRGVYDFSRGSGDNAVLREGDFISIIRKPVNTPVLFQSLVIEYPHIWSFPVRDIINTGNPFLFSRYDYDIERERGVRTNEFKKAYRRLQIEKMMKLESYDNACYPVTGAGRWHDGIHIKKTAGHSVYSAGPGRLVAVKAVEANRGNIRSTCFALVKHQISEAETLKEFYSLYMHLSPVDIARRLYKRFNFNEEFETGDWLDQIFQHIQPKRIIIRPKNEGAINGILNDRMPYLYRTANENSRTNERLGQREMIYLCPIGDYHKLLFSDIEKNDNNNICEIYSNLNNIDYYKVKYNDKNYMYRIYHQVQKSNGRMKFEERYIKVDDLDSAYIQSINSKEFIYYRLKLTALMKGEVVVINDEDNLSYKIVKKDKTVVFSQKLGEVFTGIAIKKPYPNQFKDIEEHYKKIYSDYAKMPEITQKNILIINMVQTVINKFNVFAEGLLSYPRNEILSVFSTTEIWCNEMKNAFKEIIKAVYGNQVETNELCNAFNKKIEFYAKYNALSNVDYHLEVNNLTKIGDIENDDLHFGIFSDDCLIDNILEKYNGNNSLFFLIKDTDKSQYFNQHHIVELMKNANYFTEDIFKSDRLVDLKKNLITANALMSVYKNKNDMFQTAVTQHLNSYAKQSEDEWKQMMQNEGAGIFEKNNQNIGELAINYLLYKFLSVEIVKDINPAQQMFLNSSDGVFSTFYHPIKFLAWLDERLNIEAKTETGNIPSVKTS